jgi:hypothetical protein
MRFCVPLPQVLEHWPQESQSVTTQSRGHSVLTEHGAVSTSGGQVPPLAALVKTLRVRVFLPSPHLASHLPYDPQEVTVQWRGHGRALHGLVSMSSGQPTPPLVGWRMTLRSQISEDLEPHVLEHLVVGRQAPTTQSLWAGGDLVTGLVGARVVVGARVGSVGAMVVGLVQAVPVLSATRPRAHGKHEVRPSYGWYEPAAHLVQSPPYCQPALM